MGLNQLLNVQISLKAAAPVGPSFSGALVAAYHTLGGSNRVMGPFNSTSQMTTAGFSSSSPTVLSAAKFFAQNPTPQTLYVGKRANEFTQVVTLTPLSNVQGTVYSWNIGATSGVGGTSQTYTVGAGMTLAQVVTAIQGVINGMVGVPYTVTASSTTITLTTSTAGTLVEFQNKTPLILGCVEATVDPGVAADLAAIWAQNQSWYAFWLDSNGAQEIEAAAAWSESNNRFFMCNSADTEIADASSTTDVAYVLKSNSYTRTALMFLQNSNMSYAGAGWLGTFLTQTPGSYTTAYKTIASVTVDTLPPGWDTNVAAKNASVYETLEGLNLTVGGMTPSGEFIDTTIGLDWLQAFIQTNLLALFANNSKIPYDDNGIGLVANNIQGSLAQGEKNGVLIPGSSKVSVPLVADISITDVGNRNLPNVTFTAQLEGAIHTLTVNGTVTLP